MHIDLPVYDSLQTLAFALVSLAVVVNALREALKLLQGQAADWVGLILRSVLSFAVLLAVPTMGRTIVAVSSGIGNALLEYAQAPLMNDAFAKAFTSFDCPTGFSISRTLLLWLVQFALFFSMLCKLFVIDIGWTVALHFVLYLGVLTVPASLFGGGGVGGYLKSLWSVATWPIIFGMLMAIISGLFAGELKAVAKGQVELHCGEMEQVREQLLAQEANTPRRAPRDPATERYGYFVEHSGMWLGLRFMGVLAVLIVMQLAIPYLGMLAAGETSPSGLAGQMLGSLKKAQGGARGLASSATSGGNLGGLVSRWRRR